VRYLTNEELIYLYQQGDKQALDKLIEQNRGIVNKLANKFYVEGTNSIDKEDLEQEGYIGLITAAKKYKFDVEKPCKFISYAVYWIYQKINRFVRCKNTNEETSLNSPTNNDGDNELMDYIEGVDYSFENIEDKLYYKQLRHELEEAMNTYNTLKEREILKLIYSWDNNKPMTYGEIGEIFGVTGSMIRNNEHTALGKIRRSPWGAIKAKELYGQKRNNFLYSIPETIERISFAERYL
jgi:RNA polymerase primary sigma factor